MGSLAFELRMTAIRPNPFIGYQLKPARKRAFPRYASCGPIFYLFVRAMSDNVAKQMKGFERKLPSRHLSLAQADTVRHKSGISVRKSLRNRPRGLLF